MVESIQCFKRNLLSTLDRSVVLCTPDFSLTCPLQAQGARTDIVNSSTDFSLSVKEKGKESGRGGSRNVLSQGMTESIPQWTGNGGAGKDVSNSDKYTFLLPFNPTPTQTPLGGCLGCFGCFGRHCLGVQRPKDPSLLASQALYTCVRCLSSARESSTLQAQGSLLRHQYPSYCTQVCAS